MKLVVALALFVAVVLARPQAPAVDVVEYTNENDGTGNYNYRLDSIIRKGLRMLLFCDFLE